MAETTGVEAEIHAEQQYVDRVYARLDELVERVRQVGRDGRARGLLDYTGEIKEDDYRNLFERDVLVDHAVRRLALLDAQRDGLVFGRLDLKEPAIHYVGRIGIRDEEQEPLVIDWRAPAAAVFYRATPVQPMGVVRRRVLRTLGPQVVAVEDDLLDADNAPEDMRIVGDGALMAALTAARGPQMRDIVATIQREQDEIIRAPAKGATLIGGGPGTGKTVVALHRAAYLLYSERERIARGGVLVVGPSPVFMSYIERVLPALGEHDSTLRALGEVHDGVVATRLDDFDVAAIKGSLRMKTVLARVAREPLPDAPREFRAYAEGRILRLDVRELEQIRRRVLAKSARYNPSRREAGRSVLDALWRKAQSAGERQEKRTEFTDAMSERDEFTEFMDAWWPMLTARQAFRRLREADLLHRCAKGVLKPADTDLLIDSWRAQDPADPSVQDVPLIDELYAQLGPIPVTRPEESYEGVFDEFIGDVQTVADRVLPTQHEVEHTEQYDGYSHIVVDEAQDLSPMQWRMLGRRGERASWTIVGDPAQSAWPDPAEADRALEGVLGKRARRTFRLSTNYRNSAEIFELAYRAVVRSGQQADLPKAVRRTGVEPRVAVVAESAVQEEIRKAARELLDAVEGTVGVVAPIARQEFVRSLLPDDPRLTVLTPLATKGLEFDAVVAAWPEEIATENPVGFRTLYVVLTRATQRLTTVGTNDDWLTPP